MRLLLTAATLIVAALFTSPAAMAVERPCWGLETESKVYDLNGNLFEPNLCTVTFATRPYPCNVYNGKYYFYNFDTRYYFRVPTRNKFCNGLFQLNAPLRPAVTVQADALGAPIVKLSLMFRIRGKCRGCNASLPLYDDGVSSH